MRWGERVIGIWGNITIAPTNVSLDMDSDIDDY
jgi:hypothetical protein